MGEAIKLLELKGVSYSYPGKKRVISDLSLDLYEGEMIGIMGRNGYGKSTLIKLIDSLIIPDSGEISLLEKPIESDEDRYSSRRWIGISFQNPDSHFVSKTLREDILFGLGNFGFSRDEAEKRADRVLEEFGLKEFQERDPRELSGGEKERAVIATLIALSPRILIFDEVFSMLDGISREMVLKTILELKKRGDIGIILISHYAEDLVYSDRILVLDDGKISKEGSAYDILTDDRTLREHSLLPPCATRIALSLQRASIPFKRIPLRVEEFKECLDA